VKSSQKKLNHLLMFLESLGSLNNRILFETEAGTKVCYYDKFRKMGRNLLARTLTSNTLKIFPGKLKNMRRHLYKMLAMPQIPRLRFNSRGYFKRIDTAILNIIAKHQNASIKSLGFKSVNDSIRKKTIAAYLAQRKADLSLNKMFKSFNLSYRHFINTYDLYAQCAIVLIGYAGIFLCLLIERFWHKCLRNIDYKKVMLNIARKFKRAKRTMRFRRTQVHPIEV
jgi:stage V sporulation protein SpoVS